MQDAGKWRVCPVIISIIHLNIEVFDPSNSCFEKFINFTVSSDSYSQSLLHGELPVYRLCDWFWVLRIKLYSFTPTRPLFTLLSYFTLQLFRQETAAFMVLVTQLSTRKITKLRPGCHSDINL